MRALKRGLAVAPPMRAQVIVLAAGASTRMGRPKALTDLRGAPALARIVEACEATGLPRPLVVLGAAHDAVRAALPALEDRVSYVHNPRPEAGRTGSLQCGLAASSASSVLVLPVDHPLVAPGTFALLAARPEPWVVPTHGGRGGHPLKLSDLALSAVQSAPPSVALRDIPAMVGLEVTRVAVDDPGVLANLDTPEDVERALR